MKIFICLLIIIIIIISLFIIIIVINLQLLNLGFEEEKVIDCLFKYENDREKCLEELIA